MVSPENIVVVINKLNEWKEKYSLKNWYLRDKGRYVGMHIYFENASNFYYPWVINAFSNYLNT